MRKQFIVDKKIQARLAIELLVILVAVPFLAWLDIFLLGSYIFSEQIAWHDVDKSVLGITTLILGKQWFFVVLLYAINIVIISFILLYYSHRFAGPVIKVNQCLRQLAEGNLDQNIRLRKRDFFRELEDGVNTVANTFSDSIHELRRISDTMRSKAMHISESELNDQLNAIDVVLNQYQTRGK